VQELVHRSTKRVGPC